MAGVERLAIGAIPSSTDPEENEYRRAMIRVLEQIDGRLAELSARTGSGDPTTVTDLSTLLTTLDEYGLIDDQST